MTSDWTRYLGRRNPADRMPPYRRPMVHSRIKEALRQRFMVQKAVRLGRINGRCAAIADRPSCLDYSRYVCVWPALFAPGLAASVGARRKVLELHNRFIDGCGD